MITAEASCARGKWRRLERSYSNPQETLILIISFYVLVYLTTAVKQLAGLICGQRAKTATATKIANGFRIKKIKHMHASVHVPMCEGGEFCRHDLNLKWTN